MQKEAARTTELAVQKFEAEVLNSQSLEFDILQKIKETEKMKSIFCWADIRRRFQGIRAFLKYGTTQLFNSGIPSQLLENRPDIKQAELELAAAKLDVKVASAEFYPSLEISAALGLSGIQAILPGKIP